RHLGGRGVLGRHGHPAVAARLRRRTLPGGLHGCCRGDACPAPARCAGSLTMLTRTLGVVTGAASLTLVFQALEGEPPTVEAGLGSGFISAFGGTSRFAAATAGLAALIMVISQARRRPR